jgi:hypothetical protein
MVYCFGYDYQKEQKHWHNESIASASAQSAAETSHPQGAQTENNNNYFEEWKRSRDTVDKFDNYQLDLRKYGFTLITGLLTAGSFLGFSGTTRIAQVAVIIVTMILVVVLYWLDTYYQGLLFGSVFRTRFLENFKLDGGLTTYISAFYGASRLAPILQYLYVGFLIGALILGYSLHILQ